MNEKNESDLKTEIDFLRKEVVRLTTCSERRPPDGLGAEEDSESEATPTAEDDKCLEMRLKELEDDNRRLRRQLDDRRRPDGDDDTTDDKNDADDRRRLRERLIQVENEYTEEVLQLQQRVEQLEQEVASAEREAEGRRRGQESSLERLRALQTERDQMSHQMSLLEDKLERSATAVRNLQLVVEQIQRENERKLTNQRKAFEEQLLEEKKRFLELQKQLEVKEKKQMEQEEALSAAQRLLDLLEDKERHLEDLKAQMKRMETELELKETEIKRLKEREAEKVDKSVIKSIVVQFLSASEERKPEIQRLLARILDFNETEMKRTSTQLGAKACSSGKEDSFYKSFVEFLEKESKKPEKELSLRETEIQSSLSKSLISASTSRTSLTNNPFVVSRSSSQASLRDSETPSVGQFISHSRQPSDNQLLSFMDEPQHKSTSFLFVNQN